MCLLHVASFRSPNVAYLKGKARESRKYSDHELWNPSDGTAYFEAFCAPTWEDLAWLKGQTKLPIVLKGILTGMVEVCSSLCWRLMITLIQKILRMCQAFTVVQVMSVMNRIAIFLPEASKFVKLFFVS